MQNDRPIDDPRLQEALYMIASICREADLAGAFMLVNEHESAYSYAMFTTWNIVSEDESLPLGFRFRVKSEEQGRDRAEQLVLGTGHMLHSLKDFGAQTQIWMGDLLANLAKAGLRFNHRPFNGRKLPRLTSEPPR